MTTPEGDPVDEGARLATLARTSPLGLGAYLGSLPGARPFYTPPHLVALNAAIMEALYGERRRLLVALPPQHGKSGLVSVLTPAFYLGTNPHRSVLLASYASKLARFLGRQSRKILERTGRPTYEVDVAKDSAAAQEWRLDGFEGGMVSAGVAGDFRGRPGDLVIVDDPIKDSKQAMSPGYLDGLWDWFTSVLEGRLAADATIIVCATRLHERDLTGRILAEHADEWDLLRLPAIAERGDPLGRKEGAALWPERYPAEYLARRKRIVGSYWWAAEYQQTPVPAGGTIINPTWWQFWKVLPARFDEVVTSWDMNLKKTTSGSYATGQVWGRLGPDRYLLGRVRGRWGFERLLVAFLRLAATWPEARRHLVEDAAVGPAAMDVLRKRVGRLFPVKVSGQGSKVARLSGAAPVIESGNVYVPHADAIGPHGERYEWVRDYVASLAAFPHGDGTDDGDATSQALAYFDTSRAVSVATSADLPPAGAVAKPKRPPIGRVNLWGDGGGATPRGPGAFGRIR